MRLKSDFARKAGALLLNISLLANFVGAQVRSAKVPLDKDNAIGSVASGRQQFTVIGDSNHGNFKIDQAILDNLDKFAAAGIKRILLEQYLMPLKDIDALVPEIKKIKRTSAKLLTVSSMKDTLREEFAKNPALPGAEKGIAKFKALEYFLRVHDQLERWYGEPATITADEIRAHSDLYESGNALTPEEKKESGRIMAEMLIRSKPLGMKIVHSGTDAGYGVINAAQDYAYNNFTTHSYYQLWLEDKTVLDQLDLYADQKQGILQKIKAHAEKMDEFARAFIKARLGPEAIEQEAETIIRYAEGEKSLIDRGEGHLECGDDLEEKLDEKLRKNAAADFAPTARLTFYGSQQEYEERIPTSRGCPEDQPDVLYFLKENMMVLTVPGAQKYFWQEPVKTADAGKPELRF